jgi:hypothetical protein
VSFLYNASAALRTGVDIWYDKLHLWDSALRACWDQKQTMPAHLSSVFLMCVHLYSHTTRPWHQEFQKTAFEWSQDWIHGGKLEATQEKNDNKTDKREGDKKKQAPVTPFRGMHKQSQLWGQSHMGCMDQIENTASNSSSVVACLFIATEMCLLRCYLTVAAPYSAIPAVSLHITIYCDMSTLCWITQWSVAR